MLIIYQSNQLDLLKSILTNFMQNHSLSSVFEPEMILLQSQGMQKWLEQEIAKDLGISANVEFVLPGRFIWSIYSQIKENQALKNAFEIDSIFWKLLSILPNEIDDPKMDLVKNYLENDFRFQKRVQFSLKFAQLLDRYFMYRPDWIEKWTKGELVENLSKHQIWQAHLWQKLIKYSSNLNEVSLNRTEIYHDLLYELNQKPNTFSFLPKRLFIFGITSLPPIYLQIFQALGNYCDVHLFFTNPCQLFWVNSPVFSVETDEQKSDFHPLLSLFGNLGSEYFSLLQDLQNKQEIDAFVDFPGSSLLHKIQNSILNAQIFNEKQKIENDDSSISIHSCHSLLREVEILHDYLLDLLEKNPTIHPADIIVMMPSIETYSPYINAVFGNKQNISLPFSLSDRKLKNTNPIIRAILQLFSLPFDFRYSTEDIFSLLDLPEIYQKFQFNEETLFLVKHWILDSGIRFALNDENLIDFDLPKMHKNSWKFGLNRMFLGYCMENGIWNDILPFGGSNGLIAENLGFLADFIQKLNKWKIILNENRLIENWELLLIDLIHDFFDLSDENEVIFNFALNEWKNLIEHAKNVQFSPEIPFILLKQLFENSLNLAEVSLSFLNGKINFCTLTPMRSIPFKVVCLLGMNENEFPRIQIPLDFDLMAKNRRKGDRTKRDDDLYLFLEAMLAAQEFFYISFIGFSIQDNSETFPSMVLSSFLDYILANFVLKTTKSIKNEEAEMKNHLFYLHNRVPFDPKNYCKDAKFSSFATQWILSDFESIKNTENEYFLEFQEENIHLDDFKRFFCHSAEFFFKKRLNIYFDLPEKMELNNEPFSVTGLERYFLSTFILEQLLEDQKKETIFQQVKLSGKLPNSYFGLAHFDLIFDLVFELYEMILCYRNEPETIEIKQQIQRFFILGFIKNKQKNDLVHWRAGKLSIKDGISLWIDHLFLCAKNIQIESKMFGIEKTNWQFIPILPENAIEILTNLTEIFEQGVQNPFIFPIKTMWKWFLNEQKGKSWSVQKWMDEIIALNENDDYFLRLINIQNEEQFLRAKQIAQMIFLPLFDAMKKENE